MTVRVALIGAGVMGTDHARIIASEIPGASLKVVCDADAGRARTIASQWGAEPASEADAVIRRADIDAVLVASPDATHGPLTLAAIAAGKPVLCEKPLAPTAEECARVIAAEVKKDKRLVQVGFMRRFDPAYVDMKAILDRGTVGKAVMMHNFHRNVSAPSWFTPEMAITNSAPHEFDIARFVLGEDYESISAFRPRGSDPAKPGAPVVMVLSTAGGQLVTVEVNVNAAYGYDVRGELVGEKGSISLRAPVASETSVSFVSGTAYAEDWRPRFAEAYRLQNRSWIASISSGEHRGASAWDGYCATLVAEAGVASLKTGAAMKVTLLKKPALYA